MPILPNPCFLPSLHPRPSPRGSGPKLQGQPKGTFHREASGKYSRQTALELKGRDRGCRSPQPDWQGWVRSWPPSGHRDRGQSAWVRPASF